MITKIMAALLVLASFAFAGALAAGETTVSKKAQKSAEEIEEYWTPERMRSAKPMPMGVVAEEAQLSNHEECTDSQAEKAASAQSDIVEFCAGRPYHGCSFEATPSTKPESIWRVRASLIHSYDDEGNPRFMPDGFLFADIEADCTVVRVWGMEGQIDCTMDVKECPDGSYVSRSGPNCEFAACP